MSIRRLAIVGLGIAVQMPTASTQLRLEGLEQVYFDRVAAPGGQIPSSPDIAHLLPATLQQPGVASTARAREGLADAPTVRDLELTSPSSKRRLWIREIVDESHPRISQVWWALYDSGGRSDVWTFMAFPNRTDQKMLTNYRLDSVSMPTKDAVVFRVRGEMVRPAGAWWVVGTEWTFTVSESAMALTRVRNLFRLSSGYDTGEEPPPLTVSTERESRGRIEIREVAAVSDSTQNACRFRGPFGLSWARLQKIAQCITGKADAKVSVRDLKAASFIERDKGNP